MKFGHQLLEAQDKQYSQSYVDYKRLKERQLFVNRTSLDEFVFQ